MSDRYSRLRMTGVNQSTDNPAKAQRRSASRHRSECVSHYEEEKRKEKGWGTPVLIEDSRVCVVRARSIKTTSRTSRAPLGKVGGDPVLGVGSIDSNDVALKL